MKGYYMSSGPDSTRKHLANAEEAIKRANERISESAILRASVLRMKVSRTDIPVVRLPENRVPEVGKKPE